MLEVDIPSFLRPPPASARSRSSSKPPDGGDDDDADAARTRILTGALAGCSNLLVSAFVSLLGTRLMGLDLTSTGSLLLECMILRTTPHQSRTTSLAQVPSTLPTPWER